MPERVNLKIDKETHKALKMLALLDDLTMIDYIKKMVSDANLKKENESQKNQ